MEKQIMLTTIDNPFNPFEQFEDWYLYDELELGYHSSERLADLVKTSDQLSDEENYQEMVRGINEFLDSDSTGLYKKIEIDVDDEN